ncbi:hypothetical protein H8E77_15255 [bacterium]|nr:hypothetical protein [bacterium]
MKNGSETDVRETSITPPDPLDQKGLVIPTSQVDERELKNVIPPKRTTPDALFEAINCLREFVKRFTGLGEEVIREREQKLKKVGGN